MLTTTVALLVAAAQFIINDVRDYNRRVVADLDILGRIIGENCTSAIEFDDSKAAAQTLAALKAKPNMLAAAVYTKDGKLFAVYLAPGQSGQRTAPHSANARPSVPGERRRPVPGHLQGRCRGRQHLSVL